MRQVKIKYSQALTPLMINGGVEVQTNPEVWKRFEEAGIPFWRGCSFVGNELGAIVMFYDPFEEVIVVRMYEPGEKIPRRTIDTDQDDEL